MSEAYQYEKTVYNMQDASRCEALAGFGKVNIVLMPDKHSTIDDIVVQDVTVPQLMLYLLGGMEAKRIILVTKDLKFAKMIGAKALKGIEDALILIERGP